jgi:hypothetical protein
MRHKTRVLLLLGISIIFTGRAWAQKIRTVRLKDVKEQTALHTFRIDSVYDDRADTGNIGIMRAGLLNKHMPVNLENGAAVSIQEFIAAHITSDIGVAPLSLHIIKLAISETPGAMKERATLHYRYAFYDKGTAVLSYEGESYVETGMDASVYIEKLVRGSIIQAVTRADEDWRLHKPESNSSFIVTIEMGRKSPPTGNILYSRSHPVQLEDFQAKPDDMSLGGAATYSGVSIEYSMVKEGSDVKLNVSITPYFSSMDSWVRRSVRNAYTLSHEQKHFDITAIGACMLADSIRKASLTQDNYKAEIERLHSENTTWIRREQAQYDTETMHGKNTKMQTQWNKFVADAITRSGCY